jgi:hypothetical protein
MLGSAPNPYTRDEYQQRFVDWMKEKEVGCGFAQSFAKREDTGGLQPFTVKGEPLEIADIELLNVLLAEACSKYEGVYIVFPNINSPQQIVALIRSLCATDGWRCDEILPEPPLSDAAFLVGLRWFLPGKQYMNYVLGFATLPEMPRTRHAPNTTLIFRTGPPGPAPGIAFSKGVNPKSDDRTAEPPPIPVHLADMPHLRPTDDAVALLWQHTTKLKRNQLAQDAHARAAKAKVTFCLPEFASGALADLISERFPLGSAGMQ